MNTEHFDNIIFDLGGVLLNLDYQRTILAFENLGIVDFQKSYSQLNQENLFDSYERGEIDSTAFRNGIRSVFECQISDDEINKAWNAMLLDLPPARIELLEELGTTKKLVLLSNTNAIHICEFNNILAQNNLHKAFPANFLKMYLSFEVGMRKPESRIFELVLREQRFHPERTLFIDDSPQHVEAAERLGIQTYLLKPREGESIHDLF